MSEAMKPKPCRYVASDEPRAVKGEHLDECGGDCAGCLPCEHRHCVIDGHRHVDDAHPLTCPSCVGDVRDDLDQITDMHARLRGEAVVRGMAGDRDGTVLGGDAMVMLAMRWREQTGLASDGDHSHELEGDPVPPLLVLATWEDAWRDHLGHDPAGTASVDAAAGYLALVLTRMAQEPDLPFEDFARDIRQLRGRLEDVLHDGEREERTRVPCLDCGARLVKRYATKAAADHHACPKCARRYTDGEFALAKADHLASEDAARYVRVADALAAIGRPEQTLRSWIRRGVVDTKRDERTGALLVWWPHVREMHLDTPRRPRARSA